MPRSELAATLFARCPDPMVADARFAARTIREAAARLTTHGGQGNAAA